MFRKASSENVPLKPLGQLFGILIILFGLFTFLLPSIFNLPSNFNDSSILFMGITCIAIGGAIVAVVKLL